MFVLISIYLTSVLGQNMKINESFEIMDRNVISAHPYFVHKTPKGVLFSH